MCASCGMAQSHTTTCRDDLDRPFRSNFARINPNRSRDLLQREDRSKLRIALTHLDKNIPLGAVVPAPGRIGSESDRDCPDVQLQDEYIGPRAPWTNKIAPRSQRW